MTLCLEGLGEIAQTSSGPLPAAARVASRFGLYHIAESHFDLRIKLLESLGPRTSATHVLRRMLAQAAPEFVLATSDSVLMHREQVGNKDVAAVASQQRQESSQPTPVVLGKALEEHAGLSPPGRVFPCRGRVAHDLYFGNRSQNLK